MKQQGNIESNKIYNPKNKRPDIPLDADEVDGAMERFIRKKYYALDSDITYMYSYLASQVKVSAAYVPKSVLFVYVPWVSS